MNYNNAQNSYVQAIYNYNVARATLEREIALPQVETLTVEDVKTYQKEELKQDKKNQKTIKKLKKNSKKETV